MDIEKQTFIGNYLAKKLKNCKLRYGIQYLSLRSELEIKAGKLYNKKLKK